MASVSAIGLAAGPSLGGGTMDGCSPQRLSVGAGSPLTSPPSPTTGVPQASATAAAAAAAGAAAAAAAHHHAVQQQQEALGKSTIFDVVEEHVSLS